MSMYMGHRVRIILYETVETICEVVLQGWYLEASEDWKFHRFLLPFSDLKEDMAVW